MGLLRDHIGGADLFNMDFQALYSSLKPYIEVPCKLGFFQGLLSNLGSYCSGMMWHYLAEKGGYEMDLVETSDDCLVYLKRKGQKKVATEAFSKHCKAMSKEAIDFFYREFQDLGLHLSLYKCFEQYWHPSARVEGRSLVIFFNSTAYLVEENVERSAGSLVPTFFRFLKTYTVPRYARSVPEISASLYQSATSLWVEKELPPDPVLRAIVPSLRANQLLYSSMDTHWSYLAECMATHGHRSYLTGVCDYREPWELLVNPMWIDWNRALERGEASVQNFLSNVQTSASGYLRYIYPKLKGKRRERALHEVVKLDTRDLNPEDMIRMARAVYKRLSVPTDVDQGVATIRRTSFVPYVDNGLGAKFPLRSVGQAALSCTPVELEILIKRLEVGRGGQLAFAFPHKPMDQFVNNMEAIVVVSSLLGIKRNNLATMVNLFDTLVDDKEEKPYRPIVARTASSFQLRRQVSRYVNLIEYIENDMALHPFVCDQKVGVKVLRLHDAWGPVYYFGVDNRLYHLLRPDMARSRRAELQDLALPGCSFDEVLSPGEFGYGELENIMVRNSDIQMVFNYPVVDNKGRYVLRSHTSPKLSKYSRLDDLPVLGHNVGPAVAMRVDVMPVTVEYRDIENTDGVFVSLIQGSATYQELIHKLRQLGWLVDDFGSVSKWWLVWATSIRREHGPGEEGDREALIRIQSSQPEVGRTTRKVLVVDEPNLADL
jgi:hypothetical protein